MTGAPESAGLRILHLEDDPADAELVDLELRRAFESVAVLRVSTREDFVRVLETWKPDVVLSDFNLPAFDGISALALVREKAPDIPYISVSGTIGEILAVELLRKGAADYVLKDHPDKLPLAVRRALAEAREHRRLGEAERELREREEQYRTLVEELPGILYVTHPEAEGSTVYVSPQIEPLLGYTPGEWCADPKLWSRRIHPEDRERTLSAFARTAETGETLDLEYRLMAKDGRVLWFHDRARLVRMGGVLVRGIMTDITERKRLEEQFLQAQKLEAVGRLAGGIAHDFNNLLTVINGYGDLLLSGMGAADRDRPYVQEICDAGARAANLTRQLLAFSRRQVVERRVLDLNAVVAGLVQMLGRLVSEDVEIRTEPAPDLGRVIADAGQVEQIIVNLVVNARDAMPAGGRITIATRNAEEAEEEREGRVERRAGRFVALSVSDTGTGIPAAVRRRIFEPFFTTKEQGKGTGLGLSTVRTIAKAWNGFVGVQTAEGRGTAFSVYFPRVEGQAPAAAASVPEGMPRGTGTLLLADDSEMLLRLAEEILKGAGYTVLTARDGAEAWDLFRSRKAAIDLVVTDTVMPGLAGSELVSRVLREKPGVRVLLMSGFTEGTMAEEGYPVASVPFLEKPFSPEKLTRKVREVLASPAARGPGVV